MSSITADSPALKGSARGGIRRLWDRQLSHYPDTAARTMYLAITVLATIVLYYELNVQGAVATHVLRQYGFSFSQFIFVAVIGAGFGAFASLFAGLADRWGRANLVVGGLIVTGLLVAFALPNASSKAEYTVYFALLSVVEGMTLVATPALIRDFSPQVGRGTAMGFWTLGPVLGSLLVTSVASHTLDSHPHWQFQYQLAGIVGLAVALLALLALRELSPQLRDQLMHSMRDRALIEARAAGIDPEKALRGHWRQMLKLDVVGSSFAIGIFLMLYYTVVIALVLYMATVFGYSEAKANGLANWYWITEAIMLVVVGVASDRLRVRKPFMIVGALISLVGSLLFAAAATNPGTSYDTFVLSFVLISGGGGMAYVAWRAAFTETVEKHNPAATATGLAVFGWIIRVVLMLTLVALPAIVPATTTLVDKAPRVQAIVQKYPQQVKVLQTVQPATLAALKSNPKDQAAQAQALSALSGLSPADVGKVVALGATPKEKLATAPRSDLAFLKANGPKVQKAGAQLKSVSAVPPADLAYLGANAPKVAQAVKDGPGQWQTWWWICIIGQLVFIPFVFVMNGRWSPRKARADEAEHDRRVQHELARLADRPAVAR
jgi:ACS family D-galactonate transporter-like MFS transporter